MNVFNRVVVIVLLLISMIVVPVVLVLPDVVIALARQGLANISYDLNQLMGAFPAGQLLFRGMGIVLAVLWFLFSALLLWLEIRRPRAKSIKVQQLTGGEAKISVDSIARRLEYHIDQLADVVKVKPVITAKRGGVDINLQLETTPEISVPMKTEEVVAKAKEVIEEMMGLKLHNVTVEIKHAPYPKE